MFASQLYQFKFNFVKLLYIQTTRWLHNFMYLQAEWLNVIHTDTYSFNYYYAATATATASGVPWVWCAFFKKAACTLEKNLLPLILDVLIFS